MSGRERERERERKRERERERESEREREREREVGINSQKSAISMHISLLKKQLYCTRSFLEAGFFSSFHLFSLICTINPNKMDIWN